MSHRDYTAIGSTPADETCIGVGEQGSRRETLIYARQLKREFPAGDFRIKAFEHDFGTYREVVAWYGGTYGTEEERKAAFDAESGCNENWDSAARVELLQAFGAEYFAKYDVKLPTAVETAAYEKAQQEELKLIEEEEAFRRGG